MTGRRTSVAHRRRAELRARRRGRSGQNVPRKEDGRLVQGQGVFVDDVKRHDMGYVHFVRSPYAHAHITSIDVSQAERADGVYGTLTGEEVAALTDPFFQLSSAPGGNIKDYASPSAAARFVGEPVAAVVADTRELRPRRRRARRGRLRAARRPHRRPPRSRPRRARAARAGGLEPGLAGIFDWGEVGRRHLVRRTRWCDPGVHFERADGTPLDRDGALVDDDPGTGQRTFDCNHQPPRLRGDRWAPRSAPASTSCASSCRTPAAGSATRSRRTRSWRDLLLARKVAARCTGPRGERPRGAWRTGATGLPRGRGGGQGRRDPARLPAEGPRRRRRVHARRATRRRHLGTGRARHVPLAQHPAGLRLGRHERGAGARRTLLSRTQHLWFSERVIDMVARELELDPVRCGGATTSAPTRCRTRRRTAASTTRATTRGCSTWRSR